MGNADLVVESNLEEPIIEVEIGGSSQGHSSGGGLCNLIFCILFLCFFLADVVTLLCLLCSWSYYQANMERRGASQETAHLTMTLAVVGTSCGAVLWFILMSCCCCCWKKAKGGNNTETVTYVEQTPMYEVGGGANVEFCAEVEVEVPMVEIEVELEAPVIEVEFEVEADVEVEIEIEAEVEVEAEIEI